MKDAFPIRPATLRDLRPLHRLIQHAYRGTTARAGWTHEADLLGGARLPIEALAHILGDSDQRIFVVFDGESLLGCVQVSRKNDQAAYIGLLAVQPHLQGAGLGRSLLAAAQRFAQQEYGAVNAEMMVIKQRIELIDYYARHGFRLTGEERPFPHDDPRFGLPKRADLAFVVLEKRLDGSGPSGAVSAPG